MILGLNEIRYDDTFTMLILLKLKNTCNQCEISVLKSELTAYSPQICQYGENSSLYMRFVYEAFWHSDMGPMGIFVFTLAKCTYIEKAKFDCFIIIWFIIFVLGCRDIALTHILGGRHNLLAFFLNFFFPLILCLGMAHFWIKFSFEKENWFFFVTSFSRFYFIYLPCKFIIILVKNNNNNKN